MIYAHTSTIYHTPWEGGSGIFFASETTLSWRWWLVRWKIVWVCFHPFWSCDLIPMHLRLLTCYGLPGNPTTVFGKDCGGTPGNWWNLLTKQKVVETISGSHGFYNFLKLQFLGLITTCLFWTKFPKTWDPGVHHCFALVHWKQISKCLAVHCVPKNSCDLHTPFVVSSNPCRRGWSENKTSWRVCWDP